MILKRNKKGVALLVVLSAIVVLTSLAVEFSFSSNVSYHLAANERDRLKAYYLARSALGFMMLELKFDRVFRQIVQSQNLGQYLGGSAQLPLCQQFPLSTGLIRAVFTGGEIPGLGATSEEGGEGAAEEETPPAQNPEDEAIEEKRKDVSISQQKSAEEFLEFEGDFDGECYDENTKINLNGFVSQTPAAGEEAATSQVEQYKQFLFRFLSKPQYEDLFKASGVRISDVVNSLGDRISGVSSGRKLGKDFSDTGPGQSKRGKLLTLLEAYLIDGVDDDWFAPIMDLFTVYGDGKINICQASEDVIQGVIRRYVDSTPGLPPLRLEDPVEMERLTEAVATGCSSGATGDQLKQQVSAAVTSAIWAVSSGQAPPPPQAPQPGAEGGAQETGFGAFLSSDSRFFSLVLTGQVKNTVVRIKTVMDVRDQDPKKWKYLYWRVY